MLMMMTNFLKDSTWLISPAQNSTMMNFDFCIPNLRVNSKDLFSDLGLSDNKYFNSQNSTQPIDVVVVDDVVDDIFVNIKTN